MALDNKDKKILNALNKNARSSIANISRKTGIKRDSILYRLNKLEESGVIKSFNPVLDPNALGYSINTFVNFSLHNLNKKNEDEFVSFLNSKSNITYVAKTTGKWDLIVLIISKDLKQFDNIITDIRFKFSKIINDCNHSSIIQEHKSEGLIDLVCKNKETIKGFVRKK
jgi:DNA-binding Lrp family transcriptional regulator